MLPDGSRDGLGRATDVMPAFARGHLGEADGSMSTSFSPTPRSPSSTAGSLLNPPRGVGWGGGRMAHYVFSTYSYCVFMVETKHLHRTGSTFL